MLAGDIRGFFDALDHDHLRRVLDQRVRDGVVRRTINKWRKAGVMDGATLHHPETGSVQGGVSSPLLANVSLHAVLDTWFVSVVRPRLRGRAMLYRYADDAVLVLSREDDARQVMGVLPKRLAKYGLTLHPDKTRRLRFPRPPSGPGDRVLREDQASRGCEFLGVSHYWGQSRQGNWVVKRRTAPKRFGRMLKHMAQWCRGNRHQPVVWQHQQLVRKLRGQDASYGLTGNMPALRRFRYEVARVWRKWLNRRSHRARMHWERCTSLLERYPLPAPVVYHSTQRRVANPCS